MMADETQPLLLPLGAAEAAVSRDASNTQDPGCRFSRPWDDPTEWPRAFKWSIVTLLCFMAFTVTFSCLSIVPIANRIVLDLGNDQPSKSASVLLVTVWELGEAIGPLFIAPLSEIFGRYIVLNVANVAFISANLLAALCSTTPAFILARALSSLAVASNVLNPAIIGDIMGPAERGSAMTILGIAPLAGGAVGPVIGGVIAQNFGWHQFLWTCVGLSSTGGVLYLTYFKETYRPAAHRPAVANQYGTAPCMRGLDPAAGTLWAAVVRPATLLASSGVLMVLCLSHGLNFTVYYIMSVTLPTIVEDTYGQSPAAAGIFFTGFTAGACISIVVCNLTLDKLYLKLCGCNHGVGKPEFRLPLTIGGSIMLPAAMLLYGWVAQFRLAQPFLLLSLAMLGISISLSTLPLYAYVVDAFGIYSASALAGLIVSRCIMGALVPLSIWPLIDGLGYGWGFTAVSAVCLSLVPIPILVMRYGLQWRQSSSYSKDG